MNRIGRDQHQFVFDPAARPAIRVWPGASVVIETLDCYSNRIASEEQVFEREQDVSSLVGEYNPVSAPIYVEGAERGDTLAVTIEAMRLGTAGEYAVTVVTRDSARMAARRSSHLDAPGTKICRLVDGHVVLATNRGSLTHPLRPMVGSIGTAPVGDAIPSLHYGASHGGNIDCPDMTVGATIQLPVNVPGALFSLGDVHALMGDAEITGVALETNADVTVRVDVIKSPPKPAGVRLDDGDSVGSVGCESADSLDANVGAAFDDLHGRLCHDYGLLALDAYHLLGAAARVRVGQCVHRPDAGWAAVRVSMPRAALPGGDLWAPEA